MANLANHFEDQWKSKFIGQLKKEMDNQKDSESMEVVSYLAWLNQDIPNERLYDILYSVIKNLGVQANYSNSSRIRSYYVGTELLINMKNKFPDEYKQNLVSKMLSALNNEYNLLSNRQLIIQTIGEILTEFNVPLLSQIESDIYNIANKGLEDIESGVNDKKQSSIFDTEAEGIVVGCIFVLARISNIMNIEDGYKKLNPIILKASSSKKTEIRQIAARCFRDLPTLDLESQLTLFSLLYDTDDVSAQAIQSVAELSDKTWDKTIIRKVLERLFFHANSEKLNNKLATAYALNRLLKNEDIPKEKMLKTKEKLSSDKFYRVRKEAKITIGG
jgi:hypothetical protein